MALVRPGFTQTDAYTTEVAVADRSGIGTAISIQSSLAPGATGQQRETRLYLIGTVSGSGLEQAENYVKSFAYRTPPPGTVISSDTPITDQVRQTGQATQLMLVSFDRQLVRELIDNSAPSLSKQANQR